MRVLLAGALLKNTYQTTCRITQKITNNSDLRKEGPLLRSVQRSKIAIFRRVGPSSLTSLCPQREPFRQTSFWGRQPQPSDKCFAYGQFGLWASSPFCPVSGHFGSRALLSSYSASVIKQTWIRWVFEYCCKFVLVYRPSRERLTWTQLWWLFRGFW